MHIRRAAVVVCILSAALVAYACSSDPAETPPPDDGTSGGTSGTSGGTSGSSGSSGDVDGGDAGPTPCTGNPLLADAGAGPVTADAGVAVRIVDNGGTFLDGPQWVTGPGGNGFLVYSEFSNTERMHRVNPDGGNAQVFRTAGFGNQLAPIGNAFRNGVVYTTASRLGGPNAQAIVLTYPDGGAAGSIPVANGVDPNDLVIGANGSIYYTDPQYQTNGNTRRIFQTLPDGGGATAFATFNGNERPNGIALSPDGTKLYVSFTVPKRVDVYSVPANGVIAAAPTAFIAAALLTDSPDGLAVDNAGNLYVAEANANQGTQSGVVEIFKPDGTKWGGIPFPTTRPTGLAFGGAEDKTLFVTTETSVFAVSGRCVGVR